MINFNSFILFIVFIITLVHFTNAKEVIALKVPAGTDAFSFDSLLWQDDNVATHTMEDVGGAEVGLKAPRDKIDFSAAFQVLWDSSSLYVRFEVTDDKIEQSSSPLVPNSPAGTRIYDYDGVEVLIDGGSEKATAFDSNDRQFFVHKSEVTDSKNVPFTQTAAKFQSDSKSYKQLVEIKWSAIGGKSPTVGVSYGFDVVGNDRDDGKRHAQLFWQFAKDHFKSTAEYGTLTLSGDEARAVPSCDARRMKLVVRGPATLLPGYKPTATTKLATTLATTTPSPTPAPTPDGHIAPPLVPTIDISQCTRLTPPASNLASMVASSASGACFYLPNGKYTFYDVRPKDNQKFVGESRNGVVVDGQGTRENAFHGTANNVQIRSMSFTRFDGTGGTTQAQQAPIRGNDKLWSRTFATGWFIYDVRAFDNGGAGGLYLGSHFTVYKFESSGHPVTGISGGFVAGGMIYDCYLHGNAFNPATGQYSNGAGLKVTWINTPSIPSNIERADFIVANNVLKSNGNVGIWFDLDCHRGIVVNNTVIDHKGTSIFFELSNNNTARLNYIKDSGTWQNSWSTANFQNAALSAGESHNILFERNTVYDSKQSMMSRQSNRDESYIAKQLQLKTLQAGFAALPPGVISNRGSNNIVFRNNRVVRTSALGTATSPGQSANAHMDTMKFENNKIEASAGVKYYWNGVLKTEAEWKALGNS